MKRFWYRKAELSVVPEVPEVLTFRSSELASTTFLFKIDNCPSSTAVLASKAAMSFETFSSTPDTRMSNFLKLLLSSVMSSRCLAIEESILPLIESNIVLFVSIYVLSQAISGGGPPTAAPAPLSFPSVLSVPTAEAEERLGVGTWLIGLKLSCRGFLLGGS